MTSKYTYFTSRRAQFEFADPQPTTEQITAMQTAIDRAMENSIREIVDPLQQSIATASSRSLTSRKLLDMMAQLPILNVPPSPAIDLYGHDLNPEQMYEIKAPPASLGLMPRFRRVIVVPNSRIDVIYQQMRALGMDVRLKPRVRDSIASADAEPS